MCKMGIDIIILSSRIQQQLISESDFNKTDSIIDAVTDQDDFIEKILTCQYNYAVIFEDRTVKADHEKIKYYDCCMDRNNKY